MSGFIPEVEGWRPDLAGRPGLPVFIRHGAGGRCDEDCPHVMARVLWAEASSMFGAHANDLLFLRTRGTPAPRPTQAQLRRQTTSAEL